MSHALGVLTSITYSVSDIKILDNISFSIGNNARVGLIGKNGAGKSTLLKIITGELIPENGNTMIPESYFFVKQTGIKSEVSIFKFIESYYSEWWDVLLSLEKYWGVTDIKPDSLIKSLSGGEYMLLQLSIANLLDPEVLLLDEPTNHLDINGLEKLIEFVNDFTGSVVIASHDTFFLNQVTTETVYLENGQLEKYGGNFDFYSEQKNKQLEAIQQKKSALIKTLKKAKLSAHKEHNRAQRSVAAGKKAAVGNDMPKAARNYLANKSSETAGKNRRSAMDLISKAESDISSISKNKSRSLVSNLSSVNNNSKQLLFEIKNQDIKTSRKLFRIEDFRIYGGERVMIAGRNGSGKTALINHIIDSDVLNSESIGLLNQNYEIVNKDKSVWDNIRTINRSFSDEDIRKQLGNFLFTKQDDYYKYSKDLSGGELARLALAMITLRPIDLLILDEPTNNLDIESINSLKESLLNYNGAVLVISHNIDFLVAIGVRRGYVIKDLELKEEKFIPATTEELYTLLSSNL